MSIFKYLREKEPHGYDHLTPKQQLTQTILKKRLEKKTYFDLQKEILLQLPRQIAVCWPKSVPNKGLHNVIINFITTYGTNRQPCNV